VANLAVTLAISATASVAAPVPASNYTAVNVALGCLCTILLAAVGALLLTRRSTKTVVAAPVVVPGAGEIVKYSRDAIFVIRESGEILSSNPAAEKLFG
jgi:PAS domain-containing protein